ncbi:hypothetical protein [Paraflavitalea pollutisoli]|uniref:hypothetical protein n=1 Tax=Paraflavitalea pollutisoli TaxID=3034143 RepID=UPI0023EC0DB7|nr:hypothetical protein [Paraflavitalea sp. H1-2-19X]
MRVIFSVEFIYRDKTYCGIVRVHEGLAGREYHVRIMNNRLDNWLYGHHIFTEYNGILDPLTGKCPDRVQVLRASLYEALKAWLASRAVEAPPKPFWRAGTNEYYVHSINPTKPLKGKS